MRCGNISTGEHNNAAAAGGEVKQEVGENVNAGLIETFRANKVPKIRGVYIYIVTFP